MQNILLENPKARDAIQGTEGIRIIRMSIDNKGKRGGGVIYVDIDFWDMSIEGVKASPKLSDLLENEVFPIEDF